MSYPLSLPTTQPLITVTHPSPTTWIIELHNGEDSRLTTTLIDQGLKPALDAVEKHWRNDRTKAMAAADKNGGKGALIIVGKRNQSKFFSNGLDYDSIKNDANFFTLTFNPLLKRVLSFPIPTIAAINGHCFAAGMILSLACDYRIMTDGSKRNTWMSMNEVFFGAPWPLSFASLLRAKIGDARLHRKIALEGHRFTPAEALEVGLVDSIVKGDTAAILEKAQEVADRVCGNASAGVWGLIKHDLYRDAMDGCDRELRHVTERMYDAAAKARL
ncbi:hypothetical protein JAAARDRAFT_70164 [Jaapia argillacea MUCL 33604]|uniref:Enoyl-CoA hydratase n=1 Tax=Jaapia argillacea MUCL 33604 TaxID=933084 RepID=A0A067PTR3_9AGAM|nr:hypothetical protein JAAARDRAFT_70164 [Jaapia argillacea MUCL 33604]